MNGLLLIFFSLTTLVVGQTLRDWKFSASVGSVSVLTGPNTYNTFASKDLQFWVPTALQYPVVDLCATNNFFAILVNESSTYNVYVSQDGISWQFGLSTPINWSDGVLIACSDAEVVAFLQGSDTVWRSTDGMKWKTQHILLTTFWDRINYQCGMWIGSFNGTSIYSTDLITWDTFPQPQQVEGALFDVACTETSAYLSIVAPGTSYDIFATQLPLSSKSTWEVSYTGSNETLFGEVSFRDGLLFAVYQSFLLASEDGTTWNQIYSLTSSAIILESITYRKGVGAVVGGKQGTNGFLAFSSDLNTWKILPNVES